MYRCNECLHQFSNTLSSVACYNVCENGDQFMSIQKESEEEYEEEE
jgi:hypothetical protein